MNLDYTDEQKMIRESLSRYLGDHYSFEDRVKLINEGGEARKKIWKDLSELGIWGAAFPEELGGLGGTPSDILGISEVLGQALFTEPFLSSVVLCGQLLREINSEQTRSEVEKIIAGDTQYCLAYLEPASGFDPAYIDTTATKTDQGYTLTGVKTAVVGAPAVDKIIVSAHIQESASSKRHPALFIVDAGVVSIAAGVTAVGMPIGDITLQGVTVSDDALLVQGDGALDHLESALEWGIVSACGEASGLCRRALELTTQYCRTREQFGTPLSTFQVLQHKMADMFIHTEELVSMSYLATIKKQENASDKKKALSAAKAQLGKSCKFVGESSVHLHGGMGMTEEMAIGHYFMHGTMLNTLFGDRDYHLLRVASL